MQRHGFASQSDHASPDGAGAGCSAPVSVLPASFKDQLSPKIVRPRKGEVEGKLWEVCVVAAGESLNGLDYTPAALKESVPIWEGLPVFSYIYGKKAAERHLPDQVRNARPSGLSGNRVGQIVEAWWNEDEQEVDALVAIDDEDTRKRLLTTHERGAIGTGDAEEDVEGFSIDAEGLRDGNKVTRITSGNSLDLVTNPAAKGRVRSLVASLDGDDSQESGGKTVTTKTSATATAEAGTKPTTSLLEQSPADQIKLLADQLGGPQRAAAIASMRAILSGLAGDVAPRKEDEVDKFAKMAASQVESLLETDDVKGSIPLREAVGKVLAKIKGEEVKEDARDEEIRALNTRIRTQAISHALAGHKDRFHCMETVRSQLDLDSFKIDDKTGEVSGLKEALDALEKSKPFLVRPPEPTPEPTPEEKAALKEAAEKKNAGKAKPPEPTPDPKPAPRGQTVRLQEDVETDGAPAVSDQKVREIFYRAHRGDTEAMTEMRLLSERGVKFEF